jgi:predicted regulator of Ras-like GTPase activity (Roadblock/LC7/MglB family)
MNSETILAALHDVEGVMGSFVTSYEGDILTSNMPPFVEPQDLVKAGPRLLSIVDTFSESRLDDPQHYVLRFADHRLYVRRAERGLLCVLSEPKVNLPALRMASKLVCRRLDQAPLTRTSLPPAAPAPSPKLPPPEPEPEPAPQSLTPATLRSIPPEARAMHRDEPTSSGHRTLVYRGRKYDV